MTYRHEQECSWCCLVKFLHSKHIKIHLKQLKSRFKCYGLNAAKKNTLHPRVCSKWGHPVIMFPAKKQEKCRWALFFIKTEPAVTFQKCTQAVWCMTMWKVAPQCMEKVVVPAISSLILQCRFQRRPFLSLSTPPLSSLPCLYHSDPSSPTLSCDTVPIRNLFM